MTDLSPAAQAVRQAARKTPCQASLLARSFIASSALKAAAEHMPSPASQILLLDLAQELHNNGIMLERQMQET